MNNNVSSEFFSMVAKKASYQGEHSAWYQVGYLATVLGNLAKESEFVRAELQKHIDKNTK